MKRFLIISFCLLLTGFVLRWLAPPLVYSNLSDQLARHDIELKCVNWHLSGFQQLTIEALCLRYKGIDANLSDVQVTLMQGAFSQVSGEIKSLFDWKNLVPVVNVAKVDILLPEKIDLPSHSDSATQQGNDKNAPELTNIWLPDIRIQQLKVTSPGKDDPLFHLTLELQQQKLQRTVNLASLADPEQLSLSLTQEQQTQEFELAWQLDIPWLYHQLQQLLPLVIEERVIEETLVEYMNQLNLLTIQSGKISGKLNMAANKPQFFQSSHQIKNLEVEFSHEVLEDPLTIQLDQEFELWGEDDAINIQLARDGKATLSDVSSVANHLLEKYHWQGFKAEIPQDRTVDIGLPVRINIALQENSQSIEAIKLNAFSLKNNTQKTELNGIVWNAGINEIAFSFRTSNEIMLTNKNSSGKNTLNTVYTQINGDVKGNTKEGFIGLREYNFTGFTGNTELIPDLPDNISWQNTLITGSGILEWQQNGLSTVTEYKASLTNLQTGPVYLDEVSSQGTIELINQQLTATQTVSISPDITMAVNASGTPDELKIKAELPATNLNLTSPITQQLDPLITITNGTVSALINSTLLSGKLHKADISLDVSKAAGSWQDYHISDLNTVIPLSINSSLQILAEPKKLSIAQVNTGAIINNLNSQFLIAGSVSEPRFQLQHLSGDVFHGSFSLEQLNYPLTLNSDAMLSISQFNLNEMVNLFGEQGIEITGTISGDIPLSFSEGLVSVEQAMVKADGEGKLRIEDNVGFQSLKNSQETLGLALSLLEDLHYSTLQSEVHLEPNGEITLAVSIAGINQKEQQPINFNPTLTTNLYTGLKALRAGQNIADSIEQRLDQ